MERATISQLKNHLSRYLQKVRSGGTVLILDRDQPVARLEPVSAQRHPADRLARLEREGLIRAATSRVPLDLLRSDPPVSGESVLEALLQEREEGR